MADGPRPAGAASLASVNCMRLSVEPLARLVTRERQRCVGSVHLYLDAGATEVVRWGGGAAWAVESLGCGSVRALDGDWGGCGGEDTALLAVADGDDAAAVAAAVAAAAAKSGAARVVVAAGSRGAQEAAAAAAAGLPGGANVVVEACALLFAAPFGGGDAALPQLWTCSGRRSQAAFPVLPWDVPGAPLERWRADDLDDARRAALKGLAGDVADAVLGIRAGQERGDSPSLQRGCSRSDVREESIHALSSPRETIARPKMSQIEGKTIEIGGFKKLDMSHGFPPQASASTRRRTPGAPGGPRPSSGARWRSSSRRARSGRPGP